MATATAKSNETNTQTATEGLTLSSERGLTTVADEVMAKLAGHACREVDGVAGMGARFRRLLGRVRPGDSLAQGVNVEVGKKECAIDVVVMVRYGYPIPTLAQEVRENVIARVETGTGLSEALRRHDWFPGLLVHMVAAGERSGALGDMFERAAKQLEQDTDGRTSLALNLLEPAIIITMGVIVTGIILSILLPILQLNTLALG